MPLRERQTVILTSTRERVENGDAVAGAVADANVLVVGSAPAVGLAELLVSTGHALANTGENAQQEAANLTTIQQSQVATAAALLLECTPERPRAATPRAARPTRRARGGRKDR